MIVKTIIIKEEKGHKNPKIQIDVSERSLNTETKIEKEIVNQIDKFLKNKLEV